MLYFICKNDNTTAKDPRAETPIATREVSEKEKEEFEKYLIKNKLHAYGEGYARYFKVRCGKTTKN